MTSFVSKSPHNNISFLNDAVTLSGLCAYAVKFAALGFFVIAVVYT